MPDKITKIKVDGHEYDIDLPQHSEIDIDKLKANNVRAASIKLIDPSNPAPEHDDEVKGQSYIDAETTRVTEAESSLSLRIDSEVEARGQAEEALSTRINNIENKADVVDVVGSKSDLNSYDTTTLTDQDVVKVLKDETKNNDTTYYRWLINSASWTYIGCLGQYVLERTSGNEVYTHSDTIQGGITYGTAATANYIVQRNSNGQITVPNTPTADGHATSKKYVDDAIDDLAITDITNTAGKTVSKVTEANGKIGVEFQDISITSSQVSDLSTTINTAINNLDVNEVGSDGKYIKTISETNGKISAASQTFDTTINNNSNNNNAPTSLAVKTYVDTYGGKIDNIQINGSAQTITDKTVNLPAYPTKASWNYDDIYLKYTASQSLTSAQKTTARANISAADNNTVVHLGTTTTPSNETIYGTKTFVSTNGIAISSSGSTVASIIESAGGPDNTDPVLNINSAYLTINSNIANFNGLVNMPGACITDLGNEDTTDYTYVDQYFTFRTNEVGESGHGRATYGIKVPNTYAWTADRTIATTADIPTKTSELTNNSGFITSSYHDSTKYSTSGGTISGPVAIVVSSGIPLHINASNGAYAEIEIGGTSATNTFALSNSGSITRYSSSQGNGVTLQFPSSTTSYTLTLPKKTDTLATLGDIQTISGADNWVQLSQSNSQQITSSTGDIILSGSWSDVSSASSGTGNVKLGMHGIDVYDSINGSSTVYGIRAVASGSDKGIVARQGYEWMGFVGDDGGVLLARGNYGNDANVESWTNDSYYYGYHFPSKSGVLGLQRYMHNVVVSNATRGGAGTASFTFKFITDSAEALTQSTLCKALYDAGFNSATTYCPASGMGSLINLNSGVPESTSVIVGVYSTTNSGTTIYAAYIPIASTNNTTMTINTDTTINTASYAAINTVTDMVQEVC